VVLLHAVAVDGRAAADEYTGYASRTIADQTIGDGNTEYANY